MNRALAHLRPPAALHDYAGSILRLKVDYALRIVKWALLWLRDMQDMSLEASMDGLAHTKRLRRSAAALEDVFEEAAIAAMYENQDTVHVGSGYAAVLRPGTARVAWKNDALVSELVERTYERARKKHPDIPARALRQIITEAMWGMYSVGRIEWRSTDLRKQGINPDDFSEQVPAVPSLDLRGQASYADPVPLPGRPREPGLWEARR